MTDYKGEILHFVGYEVDSIESFPFSAEKYSKFKYGAVNIAKEFGYALAEKFIEKCFSKTYDGTPIIVVPSAYSHIPTASFYLKRYFVNKLNDYLHWNGYPVTTETKIYRTVTYREDYGEMSAEDRYKLIKGDRFYVDKEYIGDKILLFLDDIKITGTHERIIINMLNEFEVTNRSYMLYFAELVNTDLPPNIENILNNYFVKDLDCVENIIKNEKFVFNTRVVKYILNASAESFDLFIGRMDDDFLENLYYNAIGNEYFKFDSYSRNLDKLRLWIK